jgi:AraC-like DNA-binding protein
MLFNPEQTHDGMAQDKTGLRYVMLYVDPGLFMKLIGKEELVQFSSPVVYDYRLEQRIICLSNAILNASDEALCSELLVSLANNFTEFDLNTAYKKEELLTKIAKEMIYYSLENVLKLDDICKELNISKFKFIRSFKANTGLSPYQYFLNCKVSLAKRLIEKNRDIYSAVADCGFVDITHLNRNFKRIYGITAYRYLNLI